MVNIGHGQQSGRRHGMDASFHTYASHRQHGNPKMSSEPYLSSSHMLLKELRSARLIRTLNARLTSVTKYADFLGVLSNVSKST